MQQSAAGYCLLQIAVNRRERTHDMERNCNKTASDRHPVRIQYLISGVAALLLLGLIYGWSIFRAPLQELFPGWSAADFSFSFTILMLMFSVGSMTAGKLALFLSGRTLYLATAVIMFVGFWGASMIDPQAPTRSLVQLDVLYCAFCGFATGMGHNTTLSNIMRWYPDKQGVASGILLMGYGFGALVLGVIADRLMVIYGVLVTFRIIGTTSLILLCIGSLFIRRPPQGAEFPSSKHMKKGLSSGPAIEYKPSMVLRTMPFWLYFAWSTAKSTACMLVVNSAAPIAAYYGAPAVIGLVVSVTNGIGRVFFGSAVDLVGFKTTARINNVVMVLAGVLMVTASFSGSIVLLIAGMLVTGLGFGSVSSVTTVFFHNLWGEKYFQSNYSLATFSLVASSVIGPNISGFLQDTATGGDPYHTTFIFMIGCCIVSVVFGGLLCKKVDF